MVDKTDYTRHINSPKQLMAMAMVLQALCDDKKNITMNILPISIQGHWTIQNIEV